MRVYTGQVVFVHFVQFLACVKCLLGHAWLEGSLCNWGSPNSETSHASCQQHILSYLDAVADKLKVSAPVQAGEGRGTFLEG